MIGVEIAPRVFRYEVRSPLSGIAWATSSCGCVLVLGSVALASWTPGTLVNRMLGSLIGCLFGLALLALAAKRNGFDVDVARRTLTVWSWIGPWARRRSVGFELPLLQDNSFDDEGFQRHGCALVWECAGSFISLPVAMDDGSISDLLRELKVLIESTSGSSPRSEELPAPDSIPCE